MSDTLNENYTKLNNKYQELKKLQNQIAIEELDRVGYKISQLTYWDNDFEGWIVDLDKLREYLNERIEELKGE